MGNPGPGTSQAVKPPDGGWGWMVLVGCFVITGFSYAFPKAVSVYFKELMHDFHIGYSDTAWISSIILAMLYGTGPVCSIVVNRFGCRPVMLIGGLLASSGMILASFSANITQLYLTAGVVTGLGLALNFQPSLIMLGRYFDKRRPLANGLAAAGSPVFLSTLSPFGQVLLDYYGWRGGFLIMGGLLLNCCTCGAVMRPLESLTGSSKDKSEAKEMLPAAKSDCTSLEMENCEAVGTSNSTKGSGRKKGASSKSRKLLDFSVFRNRGFIIYTISKFILVLGLFVPPIMIVNYAKDTGVPDTEAAFLLSIIGFIDIFARPLSGVVAGLDAVRPRVAYFFSFSMLCNGLTDVLSAKAATYTGMVAFCVFFGVTYGMVGALQFEVLMDIVGSQKFPSAIGLLLLIEAFAVLIGPPSAGHLVDTFKNYELIFYMAGAELILSSVFLSVATYLCLKGDQPKNQKESAEVEDVGCESAAVEDTGMVQDYTRGLSGSPMDEGSLDQRSSRVERDQRDGSSVRGADSEVTTQAECSEQH
ncbi:monocarboxylate transporter 3 [Carcharodon carcharias]|uniref:monocarboxylate transporter 3 n=1 Tax=Carcharodon carcharias TaxID=13397 RepID=UPI001B7DC87A|nr:monocarboxylate transporter 3 [Carcharodon carcharias]